MPEIDPELCDVHTEQLKRLSEGFESLTKKVDEVGDEVKVTNKIMLRAVEAFEGRTKIRTALFDGALKIGQTLAEKFEAKTLFALGFVILSMGALIGTISVADVPMPWTPSVASAPDSASRGKTTSSSTVMDGATEADGELPPLPEVGP